MVFTLPKEFQTYSIDESDDEEGLAKLLLDPQQVVSAPPVGDYRHLKALYMNGFINGKPTNKMGVDGDVVVNVMPMSIFKKIGKTPEELVKTNMTLKDYSGRSSKVKGAINVELTIGSKTLPTAFFVIDGKVSYSALLGGDWIHANYCIPSTMHQFLIQWVGDQVEVVPADRTISIAMTDFQDR